MGAPRIQAPGSPHAMISDALDAPRRTVVQAEFGLDASTLSNWCDASESAGKRMPAAMLDALARRFRTTAGVVIARHFAAIIGAELREPGEALGSLAAAVSAVSRASGQMSAHMIEAIDPEGPGGVELTPGERRQLIRDLDAEAEAIARARALLMRGVDS